MSKHKGFTLMEMMIVIAVMGILASMMMISSSESISTARASSIVTNLRNFSMAAMAYYTDNIDTFGKTPDHLKNDPATLKANVEEYMHNEGKIPDEPNIIIYNNSGTWWAGYNLTTALDNDKVREKLQGRSESANLKGTTSSTPPAKDSADDYDYTTKKHTYVWIQIRSNRN